MKRIKFLHQAEEEMYGAAKFYQSHASGLGHDFLLEVEKAATSISKSPMTWPRIKGELRRCLIKRFPFAILYCDEP